MPLRLSIILLGLLLSGTALAQDSGDPVHTLSCSVAAPAWAVACFVETPVVTFGGFEVAIGLDARAARTDSSIAGYGVLAYYAPTWSAWLEVAIPQVVPPLGRPDPFRAGFTLRF